MYYIYLGNDEQWYLRLDVSFNTPNDAESWVRMAMKKTGWNRGNFMIYFAEYGQPVPLEKEMV